MNINKKQCLRHQLCLHPHDDDDGGGDAADGNRTYLQDTFLQINFNRIGHPQVQSCDYSILNSFTEQTLLHGKQENFFSHAWLMNSVQLKVVWTVRKIN